MKKRNCIICVAKTKALISFAVAAKLICTFVFAWPKIRFSHGGAHTGADPGLMEGGFKSIQGGSFITFYLIFRKFPHEIEIIWSQRGVRENPLNPL